MAEPMPLERLQPALLDRLADDTPGTAVEPREMRVVTRQQLRAAVLRDLAWLFNATRPSGDAMDWERHPDAERSVLNYGLPALSGETSSTLDVTALEAHIRRAIVDFEPRIDASTLQVAAVASEAVLDHRNQIQIEIRGSLWAQPVPIELLLRTEVDLETGQVDVHDQSR